MRRGGAIRRWGAFVALLALLCQALGIATVMPTPALASGAVSIAGFAICHTEDGQSSDHGSSPQSCLACPLCQVAQHAAAPIPPDAIPLAVPLPEGTIRHAVMVAAVVSGAVAQAAPPRGPPDGARAL